ncbi:MAG: type II secretion system F family protein [Patescibacteria group bacterium]
MALYRYIAENTNEKKVSDFVSAFNEKAARKELRNRGYTVKTIKGPGSLEMKILRFLNPIKTKDLVVFSRQFAIMISANLPVVKALEVIVEQTDNIKLKAVISDIAFEVDAGSRLSEVLADRPNVFSQFYINVVKSGETSGKLDEVLNYLADEIEKDYNIVSKIKGTMIYPLFVLGGLVIVGGIMMIFVVPEMTKILERSGAELPLSTRIVMGASKFLVQFWWLVILMAAGSFFGLRFAIKKNETVRGIFDSLKLRLPVFGGLLKNIYIVRFTRSMHTLIISGITITKSLSIVSEVVGNNVYKNILEDTLREVEEGSSISSVLIKSDKIPPMVPQMIGVGEKTGRMDVVLDKITEFYDGEINKTVNNLVSLMEPIIIAVLGIGVGIMIAAILLPMYELATQL